MQLRYITCSDPREFNDIHDIVKLGQLSPRVEIAVQAHPSKMSHGMPRNEWFQELLRYVMVDKHKIRLAVHVNREWCDQVCRTGTIPEELIEFFEMCRNGNMYDALIKRWQFNMPVDTANNINVRALKKLMNLYPEKYFIFQYNNNTHDAIYKLHDSGARFSVLYDASGGRGISPTSWSEPLFLNNPQGYSGGLSPENIAENLDKISHVAVRPGAHYNKDNKVERTINERSDIWIDAEGKLKTDDKFDIARARQYILNAENWLTQQKQK